MAKVIHLPPPTAVDFWIPTFSALCNSFVYRSSSFCSPPNATIVRIAVKTSPDMELAFAYANSSFFVKCFITKAKAVNTAATIGSVQQATSVNFQPMEKAMIIPAKNPQMFWKNSPTFFPIPNSIVSIQSDKLLMSSPAERWSHQGTSCLRIALKVQTNCLKLFLWQNPPLS